MTRLRLITPADSAILAELQVQNRTYLSPWEPARSEEFFTDAGQRADLDAALERHDRGDAAPFVILDDDGAVVGRLTLSGIVRGAFQSCAMGYWVAQERTGKGLATEAVATALNYAFTTLRLHRVQAEFGLAPGYLKIAGTWQDHLMFQRLTDEA